MGNEGADVIAKDASPTIRLTRRWMSGPLTGRRRDWCEPVPPKPGQLDYTDCWWARASPTRSPLAADQRSSTSNSWGRVTGLAPPSGDTGSGGPLLNMTGAKTSDALWSSAQSAGRKRLSQECPDAVPGPDGNVIQPARHHRSQSGGRAK